MHKNIQYVNPIMFLNRKRDAHNAKSHVYTSNGTKRQGEEKCVEI